MVTTDFSPDVQTPPGYQGYVLADVREDDRRSLSVVVLKEAAQAEGLTTLAQRFIADIPVSIAVETPSLVDGGDLMTTAINQGTEATPAMPATPVAPKPHAIVVRVRTGLSGTNPVNFVPLAKEGWVPIIASPPGVPGYLWLPSEGGFTAVSLDDPAAAARESTVVAADVAAKYLTAFTDGNLQVSNATGGGADLRVVERQGSGPLPVLASVRFRPAVGRASSDIGAAKKAGTIVSTISGRFITPG